MLSYMKSCSGSYMKAGPVISCFYWHSFMVSCSFMLCTVNCVWELFLPEFKVSFSREKLYFAPVK